MQGIDKPDPVTETGTFVADSQVAVFWGSMVGGTGIEPVAPTMSR
jgi:hypothetical protein